MKIIYVAGPYRSDTEWGVEENIMNAEKVALEVWRAGFVALCPHKNTAHFGGACPDDTWLRGDIEMLKRCDAVILVPGWENSSGVKAELEKAGSWNIPVFCEVKDIKF